MKKSLSIALFITLTLLPLIGSDLEDQILFTPLSEKSDWSEESHEKLKRDEIKENLTVIFNTSEVQKLRIVIESHNWNLMNEDLRILRDKLGNSKDFLSAEKPITVPCSVFYNGTQWYKVGVRFKGNSSLYSARDGKIPLKLNFDEFEDQYKEIKNQRFYGIDELNLKSNFKDPTQLHELIAADLFRDFGLVSPRAALYEIYLNVDDSGDESNDIYMGLYTVVEEVEDTVIKTQYANEEGNLYKPEGEAATFSEGSYNQEEYNLQTKDDSYADITRLYETINDKSRLSDPVQWKRDLEDCFDVNLFLKWLAANSVMQNWDTYGQSERNYFLYYNPDSELLEWIPWDSNEALMPGRRNLPLEMTNVSPDWPLISYILDDGEYYELYREQVAQFAENRFNPSELSSLIDTYVDLIEGSLSSSSRLGPSIIGLKDHIERRYEAALLFGKK